MADIALSGVRKRYPDGFEAVKGIDLQIADGELVILVGPSGCGKTTALRMIAGLEEITEGEIRIDGVVVNDVPPKNRDIAMVFQNYALYPHMTVRANMAFALKLRGVPVEEREVRVQRAAQQLGLLDHLDRRPALLSGGQRQRVAMGRAIVREPKAFLMDEPLSNLDAKLRVETRATIAELQQRLATTMVYVTHDQVEAVTLGHRVAVLGEGRLEQFDSPKVLYEKPNSVFVGGFIGSPAMNFTGGTLTADGVRLAIGEFPLSDRLRRALVSHKGEPEVIVGVRPEAFEDAAFGTRDRMFAFEAPITLVEELGYEIDVHFALNGLPGASPTAEPLNSNLAVARLHAESKVAAGTIARLCLDTDALHFFDRDTQKRIVD